MAKKRRKPKVRVKAWSIPEANLLQADWMLRVQDSEDRRKREEERADRAEEYCQDYGNSNGTCEAGYWQHPGLICHHCSYDRSADDVRDRCCPLVKKQMGEKPPSA